MFLEALLGDKKPVDLEQVIWPGKMRLLVTAPHPDDFDAISVTLRHLANCGHELFVLVAETGSGFDRFYGAGMSARQRTIHRNREQTASLRYFGLDSAHYRIAGLKNADDDQVVDCPENRSYLETLIREIKPDLFFMPHGNDTNRAHRDMCAMVRAIASGLDWPVALMLNSDVKTVDMRKDFYMGFGPDKAQWKARLLRYHDSQHQRNLRDRGHGFDERVLRLNAATATALGLCVPYAASFEMVCFR